MEAQIVIPKSKSSAIKTRMENCGSSVNAVKVETQESVVPKGTNILSRITATVEAEKKNPANTDRNYIPHDDWHWNDH